MKGNKIKRKDETNNAYRTDTSPTPPPRANYSARQTPPPYRNDAPQPKSKQEATDIKQTEPYVAPRRGDPLAQMGMKLATSELEMECALLVEVGKETLHDHIQDRETLGGKQNRDRQPLTGDKK